MEEQNQLFELLCQFDAWLKIRTEAQRQMDRLQDELRRAQAESNVQTNFREAPAK